MKLSRYKRSSLVSYALGATLCFELLKTQPQLITRVFLRPAPHYGDDLQKILASLKQHHIDIIESAKAFNILGAKDNCLIITEFQKPTTNTISIDTPHIVLVNPSDAGNLGTIMRSATAFGFKNLIIITPSADPYDPKTIRASMGACFHLNIQTLPDFATYQANFPTHRRYAFMLDSTSRPAEQFIDQPDQNYSLIFGNEASGLPLDYAKSCQPVILKQSDQVDSLNLSIAVSVAMYLFSQF